MTHRAVEAFSMEVLAHGLHPSVARFDGEVATSTHGLEHSRPVWNKDPFGSPISISITRRCLMLS